MCVRKGRERFLFTFNRYFTLWSGTDCIVCTTNISPLLWHIAQFKIRFLISRIRFELRNDIRFILGLDIPCILIVFWIAVSYANQCIVSILLLSCDCAIGSVFNNENKKNVSIQCGEQKEKMRLYGLLIIKKLYIDRWINVYSGVKSRKILNTTVRKCIIIAF